MKYLVNTKTKEILKEAKSIGQSWVDTQADLEFLELEDAVLEDGSFRNLTDEDVKPIITKVTIKQIEKLETSILRAYREVLSNNTTQEVKDLAQAKIDDVEAQIQELRLKLI